MSFITAEKIKEEAYRTGFDLCGITSPQPIETSKKQFLRWLDNGYQGEMDYLKKNIERRIDPSKVLPDAKSIIMLGLNYYQENEETLSESDGLISRYARGRDYHKVIASKIKRLIATLLSKVPDELNIEFKWFTDFGPFLERSYAEQAGLGFIGKNGMLINKEIGSWFFIAEILTNLDLEFDNRDPFQHGHCGTCRLCIDACPTSAILSPRKIDSTRCISYLTIERPSQVPEELAQKQGKMFFGCDVCQEVCPHNAHAKVTKEKEFLPDAGVGEKLDMNLIISLATAEDFLKLTAGTPLTRPKLKYIKRNAQIVLQNC